MRRWYVVILAALLLMVSITPAAALGDTDLTSLARYSEDDALVFASIRTDDGYIATLDTLLDRTRPFLPAGTLPPEVGLVDLFDLALSEEGVGTFSEDVRPWLGNSIALTLYVPDDFSRLLEEPDVLFAVDLADGAAALAFFEPLLAPEVESGSTTVETIGDFTVYTSNVDGILAFGDDVVFASNRLEVVPIDGVGSALNTLPAFSSALGNLPEESYNIAMVISAELQRYNLAASLEIAPDELPPLLETVAKLTGPIALGATILGDESLTIDVASQTNMTTLADLGLMTYTTDAVDTSLLGRLPANAVGFVQGAEFGTSTQIAIDNFRILGDYIKETEALAELVDPDGFMMSPTERVLLNRVDLAWLFGGLNLSFAGATGLSLENDVLPVLDGDAIIFATVDEVDDFFFPVIPGATVLFQTSDSDGAAALVEQLGTAAENYDLAIQREAVGNGQALLLPSDETLGFPVADLDVLLGSSDDLVFIGSRNAIDGVLADGGTRMTDTDEYNRAASYFLDGSQSVMYLAGWPLFSAIDALIKSGEMDADDINVQQVYTGLSLFESASISQRIDENGVSVARMVITLSASPRPLPVVPDA